MPKTDPVIFLAVLPGTQGAFRRHGGGDGVRVQFDIPESEVVNAVPLIAFPGVVMKVTVEVASEDEIAVARKVKAKY